MTRWTISPAARVEVIDRLLEENLRRAAAQGDDTARITGGLFDLDTDDLDTGGLDGDDHDLDDAGLDAEDDA
jgi:hypothetical protein